jgi:uncharacterized membrane protein YedE/YeeE
MSPSTAIHSLLGGALLGTGLIGLLFLTGRTEGVSGLIAGVCTGAPRTRASRALFLAGMALAGALLALRFPEAFRDDTGRPLAAAALGGLLVGCGAALANGCTSGHAVLGAVRFSPRSWLAALLFGLSASLTVALYPPSEVGAPSLSQADRECGRDP